MDVGQGAENFVKSSYLHASGGMINGCVNVKKGHCALDFTSAAIQSRK